MSDLVTVERRDHVLIIGVDRQAKRNAWNREVIGAVAAAFTELRDDVDLRAGVVFGHGDNFTAGLAHMLAEKGIRVNGVAPGPVWTPLIPSTMPDEKVKTFGSSTPIGRAGQPAELAPAYVYLASDDSTYVTGEVIAVTGGRLMI